MTDATSPAVYNYWWTGVNPGTVNNFGDELGPWLLDYYCDVRITWAHPQDADIVVTGSLLEHVPEGWNGHIMGSGRLFEDSDLAIDDARIWAIRGPLSAKGIRGDYVIGDPGLLADEMLSDSEMPATRDYDLGILPHWKDGSLVNWDIWYGDWKTLYISPGLGPLEVAAEVGRCRRLATSSLHGMVLADAFGIPRRVEYCKELDKEGQKFKFLDYSASVGTPLDFGRMMEANRSVVEDRKHALYDVFAELKAQLWRQFGGNTGTASDPAADTNRDGG